MASRYIKPPSYRAFTLIELLVVVAIIALLISILLPSLNRAKKQARQLMCTTNLRTVGQAARLYAADNQDYLPRALQGVFAGFGRETHSFATCLPKYLGWSGSLAVKVRAQRTVDVPGDQNKLWSRRSPFGTDWWRVLFRVYESIPQFQCPDYPVDVELRGNQWAALQDGSPLDYVASAFPIPYLQSSITADSGSDLVWDSGAAWQAEGVPGYITTSKLEDFPTSTSPAAMIYVTESHVSLPWKNEGARFHHVFLGSQLPFAGRPRIANDQRHPGGINALFFDGHARVMDLHEMDPGYPNPLDRRLKWFTVMPDDYEP